MIKSRNKKELLSTIAETNATPILGNKIPLEWNITQHINQMSIHCTNKAALIEAIMFLEALLRHFWENNKRFNKKIQDRHALMEKELNKCILPGGKRDNQAEINIMHKHYLLILGDLIALTYHVGMIEQAPITDVIE